MARRAPAKMTLTTMVRTLDSESDSESGEDAESGESGDGSVLRPLDLSALEKSISGDTSQASILSYEPVQTCVEIELIMRLVGEHSSSAKRKASKKPGNSTPAITRTVNYASLASAFNASLAELHRSVSKNQSTTKRLRLKSAAHIKDFFERTDCGLFVSASCAGVSKDMADLRRRLRDETSAVVPDVRALASSTQPVVAATKAAPVRQLALAKRKPRCCKLCRSEDRGEWPLRISRKGRQQGQQVICTNHACGKFMATPVTETEDRRGASREKGHSSAGATSVTVSATKKAKEGRAYKSCRDAGLGEHPLKQSGYRERMPCTVPMPTAPQRTRNPRPCLIEVLLGHT